MSPSALAGHRPSRDPGPVEFPVGSRPHDRRSPFLLLWLHRFWGHRLHVGCLRRTILWRPIDGQTYRRENPPKPYKSTGFGKVCPSIGLPVRADQPTGLTWVFMIFGPAGNRGFSGSGAAPGAPKTVPKCGGAQRPIFLNGFPGPRGRPDPENR